jgi:hypothetical protein
MDEYFLFPGKIIAAEFEDKNAKILVLTKIHKFFPASEIMEVNKIFLNNYKGGRIKILIQLESGCRDYCCSRPFDHRG